MYKAYKFRIYPTETQKVLIEKHIGCARFVYNLSLETKQLAFSGTKNDLSAYDLHKQLTELKKDLPWLSDVSASCLQTSICNMETAYKKFYKRLAEYPKFKKKTNSGSYSAKRDISIFNGVLKIEKFRDGIQIRQHRAITGIIKNATISKTPTGKYFASLLTLDHCEKPYSPSPLTHAVGIDLGIKTFAVLSNGIQYNTPSFLRKSLTRLTILKHRASKKKIGSANRSRADLKVALIHERVTNQRANFLHNVSNEITNRYDTICIEDLAVSNMVKNRKLSLSISDAGWGSFLDMLRYKSEWKGKNALTVGRFYPSSKTCSNCGNIKEMSLIERVYTCMCGLSIDRDVNAAINIRNSGILRASESVELPIIVGAVKQKKCRQYSVERL